MQHSLQVEFKPEYPQSTVLALYLLFASHMLLLQVRITPLTTKRVEHSGIKVQLIGQIELASERGSPHDFVSLGERVLRL